MFKKYTLILIFQAGILFSCHAQTRITLEWCLDRASLNNPRSSDSASMSAVSDNKMRNIRSGNLPQFELNGKASYQSDVIALDMSIPIPGITFPQSPRDQYKLSLDITQNIYDAGFSKSKQEIEEVVRKLELSQLEMDIRSSRMLVKDLYYNVLIIQTNQKIIEISLNQLLENRNVIQTGIKNGVLLSTDLDLLDVEIIKLQQSKTELQKTRIAGLEMLSLKTGVTIPESTVLETTGFVIPESDSLSRIEQSLFELQGDQLEKSKALSKTKSLPRVFAFGQFGYGNPALNMLKDEFEPYYVVGAGLKWTLWDWKTHTREKEILSLQQNIIQNRKSQFEMDINAALINQRTTITNHEENIIAYEKILELRSRIALISNQQLQKGVIKTMDYITYVNQETIAKIQLENEKTLLQQSIAKYLEIQGEL